MILYNRKIDVIIPAYNVPDKILSRCLASIACQEIVDDLEVIIVDDASTEENYAEVIKIFSPLMKINLLRYEVNGGPGVARQYGIDHTCNEYITFIDADDTFHGAFSLMTLRESLEMNINNVLCTSIFEEVRNDCGFTDFIFHPNDLIWMFGKIYRRDFIQNNNIRFHPTSRANEDSGFNKLCQIYSIIQNKNIFNCNFPTYFWHINNNSITRQNNCQYSFGGYERGSNFGYVENMKYVIEIAKNNNIDNNFINNFIMDCMGALYASYLETITCAPEYKEYNLNLYRDFYKSIYLKMDLENKDEILLQRNIGNFINENEFKYTCFNFLEDLRKE